MLHAVTVRRVPVEYFDPDRGCRVLHGIGFAWRCGCGASGPIMQAYRLARDAGREHRAQAEADTALADRDRRNDDVPLGP